MIFLYFTTHTRSSIETLSQLRIFHLSFFWLSLPSLKALMALTPSFLPMLKREFFSLSFSEFIHFICWKIMFYTCLSGHQGDMMSLPVWFHAPYPEQRPSLGTDPPPRRNMGPDRKWHHTPPQKGTRDQTGSDIKPSPEPQKLECFLRVATF